jgi:hypothetical protein
MNNNLAPLNAAEFVDTLLTLPARAGFKIELSLDDFRRRLAKGQGRPPQCIPCVYGLCARCDQSNCGCTHG